MSVSIIIPVYQVSDYIERCLISVMSQSYTDIECIIVDDATKDDSVNKCITLINNYKGSISFQIIHHDYNRGLSVARNTGTRAAVGDYIYYLDGDDEIATDCIEKLMKVAKENPDTEIVIGNAQTKNNDKLVGLWLYETVPSQLKTNRIIVSCFHQYNLPVVAWNKLIKRTFVTEHDLYFMAGIIHEDYLWTFYVLKYISEISIVRDVTYVYNKRPGSISSDSDAQLIGCSWKIIYDDILHNLTPGKERNELAYYAGGFCNSYLKYKQMIPSYKEVSELYHKEVRHYHCCKAFVKLLFVKILGSFCYSYNIYSWLIKIKSIMRSHRDKK